jgi:2-phospho-L-lactate guanylyltransferase
VTQALVPVKRLAAAKSRLFALLDPEQREAFTLAMLRDVVACLLSSPALDRTTVVTPDDVVADAARAQGADALVRDDPGLNAALSGAVRTIELSRDEPLLVVLGDVAGGLPADIEALFDAQDASQPASVVLAPSSDGGTSALLRTPHDAIPPCFGPDSAKRHREAAAKRGVPFLELALPSLAIDLDTPGDIESFLKTAAGGPHTRAYLCELDWGIGP